MTKTLIVIAILIAVFVAGVLILAASRPDSFRVQRSLSIKAPPEKLFALINDFKAWTAWSPWEKKDPAMKRSYGALTSGKGAAYAWDGDKNVGQGSMEITDTLAPSRVALRLDFVKPFEAHNTVEFTLKAEGEGTTVTWTMDGPTPFFGKIIHVFIDMDRMVGKDFESGLANLKTAAEK
jgi:uncharacterized protein YndB with AHSA1/START domain